MEKKFVDFIRFIRKDRAFKIILTVSMMAEFFITAFFPSMAIHSACLGFATNIIWLWEC